MGEGGGWGGTEGGNPGVKGVGSLRKEGTERVRRVGGGREGGKRDSQGEGNWEIFLQHCIIFFIRKSTKRWQPQWKGNWEYKVPEGESSDPQIDHFTVL